MTMTDPIADMLTRLRNANHRMIDDVRMPFSNLKEGIARVLEREGYIDNVFVEEDGSNSRKQLVIRLKYTHARKRVISGLKRISRPGQRCYQRGREVPRVLNGMGIAIVSTNQGIITDREARERNVGGEVLCEVW